MTAGARKLLVIIYNLLKNQEVFKEVASNINVKKSKSTKRKYNKIKRMIDSLPENEVIPLYTARLKNTFIGYEEELDRFQKVCREILGKEVLVV